MAAPALVLGLVLGGTGTAVAHEMLTKSAVRKIAGKVVQKKAHRLSVAHAASADIAADATRLGGLPSADYQERRRSLRVNIPVDEARTFLRIQVPLTEGFWEISYTAHLVGGSGRTECGISASVGIGSGPTFTAITTSTHQDPGLSATTTYQELPQPSPTFYRLTWFECRSETPFHTPRSQTIRIDLTRLDHVDINSIALPPP